MLWGNTRKGILATRLDVLSEVHGVVRTWYRYNAGDSGLRWVIETHAGNEATFSTRECELWTAGALVALAVHPPTNIGAVASNPSVPFNPSPLARGGIIG